MQAALSKVTGVTEVISVSTDSNTAVVKVEKDKVAAADLTAAVKSAGFGAKVLSLDEVTLKVTGMTCEACPAKVEAALGKVDGVTEVISVSTDSNTAVVKVEKDKVTAADLAKAVKSAGFSAEILPIDAVTLKVTGMTCEACPAKVEAALGKVDGVTEVISVSTADNMAVVKVEKGKVTAADLTAAVKTAGFTAEVLSLDEVTLKVAGMTCEACPAKVEAALGKVDGVTEVISVSTDSNTAVVKVEKDKVTAADLAKAVKSAGFSAEILPIDAVTLKVTGMTCEACPAKVEAALGKVDGVTEVISVSTADNMAVVKVEKGKVTAADLTAAVKTAGFTAEVVMPEVDEVTLKVTGMMCEACPAKVEAALGKVDGVTEVISVSMADSTAVVKVE